MTDASGLSCQYGLPSEGKAFAPQSVAMDTQSRELLEQSLQQLTHRRDEAVKLNVEPGPKAREPLGKKMEPPVSTYSELLSHGWNGKTMSEKAKTRLFVQNGSKADVSKEAEVPPTDGPEVTFKKRSAEHVGGRLPSISSIDAPGLEKVENDVGVDVSDGIYNWSVNFDDKKEPVLVETKAGPPSTGGNHRIHSWVAGFCC